MKKNFILDYAHLLLKQYISLDDVVVDATMGNGYDTLFLSRICKKVYAFDIQEKAVIETKKKLFEHQIENVELVLDTHEHINQYVTHYKAIIFNLGYLPHGDKSITTRTESTIPAITTTLPHLLLDGFMQLVVYTGHAEGKNESKSLEAFLSGLDSEKYKVIKVELPYQDNNPPYIFMIHKVKDES